MDGVPNPLDVDDDGDLLLDNFEPSGVPRLSRGSLGPPPATTFGIGADLELFIHQTVNANATALMQAHIDTALSGFGFLPMQILPGETVELDCTGLSYCSAGGTGTGPTTGGINEFPECCDPDGDGFGTMAPDPLFNPNVFPLKHGATTQKIGTGDVLIQRVTTGGAESEFPATVQYVFATVPALVSYNDGQGNSATVSYPVAGTGPGTPGNGFPVTTNAAGDAVVTFTFWRPQRTPIPGEEGQWIDIGGLSYLAMIDNKPCPSTAYASTDPMLSPVSIPMGPGVGGFLDMAADQPASPGHTFSYTLNLTQCLAFHGLSWSSGQERELIFQATNLNDTANQHVRIKRT